MIESSISQLLATVLASFFTGSDGSGDLDLEALLEEPPRVWCSLSLKIFFCGFLNGKLSGLLISPFTLL